MSLKSIGNWISKVGNFVKKLGTWWFRGSVAGMTTAAIAGALWNPLPALWYFSGGLALKSMIAVGAGSLTDTLGGKIK